MKVLLSAYACEPGKGSEPGVGWHWAQELARLGHETWVLTRINNRSKIEAETAVNPPPPNLHFVYYDLPRWARWWKKGHRGIHLYYVLWQFGAFGIARKYHRQENFDLVHHITFGVVRHPSFMGRLGIPFVFGPLGGGERAPWRLRAGYPLRGLILDAIRDLLNLGVRFDPLMRHTYRRATHILAKTSQSQGLVPRPYQSKARVQLEIGVDAPDAVKTRATPEESSSQPFRVLFVGRFLYWKGVHLGLEAFSRVVAQHPGARMTLVGQGPEEEWLRQKAERLGLAEAIDWIPWVAQETLWDYYRSHDALLFPSLHDSSGNAVLEALAHGLPVVCLDLGGPAELVDATCGKIVVTEGCNADTVVDRLAVALTELANHPGTASRLSQGALTRARQFAWDAVVSRAYSDIAPCPSI